MKIIVRLIISQAVVIKFKITDVVDISHYHYCLFMLGWSAANSFFSCSLNRDILKELRRLLISLA